MGEISGRRDLGGEGRAECARRQTDSPVYDYKSTTVFHFTRNFGDSARSRNESSWTPSRVSLATQVLRSGLRRGEESGAGQGQRQGGGSSQRGFGEDRGGTTGTDMGYRQRRRRTGAGRRKGGGFGAGQGHRKGRRMFGAGVLGNIGAVSREPMRSVDRDRGKGPGPGRGRTEVGAQRVQSGARGAFRGSDGVRPRASATGARPPSTATAAALRPRVGSGVDEYLLLRPLQDTLSRLWGSPSLSRPRPPVLRISEILP